MHSSIEPTIVQSNINLSNILDGLNREHLDGNRVLQTALKAKKIIKKIHEEVNENIILNNTINYEERDVLPKNIITNLKNLIQKITEYNVKLYTEITKFRNFFKREYKIEDFVFGSVDDSPIEYINVTIKEKDALDTFTAMSDKTVEEAFDMPNKTKKGGSNNMLEFIRVYEVFVQKINEYIKNTDELYNLTDKYNIYNKFITSKIYSDDYKSHFKFPFKPNTALEPIIQECDSIISFIRNNGFDNEEIDVYNCKNDVLKSMILLSLASQ